MSALAVPSYPPRRPGVRSRLGASRSDAAGRTDAKATKTSLSSTGDRKATQARRRAEDHGLAICSICEEPIRGLVCYRGGQACHFGCEGASRGDTLELERLKPCHLRALDNVREATRHLHEAALPRLRDRMDALGFKSEDADKTLAWIRDQAAVIIHVDLARFGEKLAGDTHYRNQFETGSSGGCLSTDTRTSWEADLFGDAYDGAAPFDRCKYGVLNVTNDPQGVRAAHSYGSSYLLLRNVRLRTTFSAKDSGGIQIEELATIDYYAHVLEQYADAELRAAVEVGTHRAPGRDSNVILSYKEAQIHGEVCLAEHVELIMANPSLRGERHRKMLERLASICHAPVVWMEGGTVADDASPTSTCSDDAAPVPTDLARTASESAALSREEEELALAIEASRLAAAEARELETAMATAEAVELDKAVELSAASFAEEAKFNSTLDAEYRNSTDLAIAISRAENDEELGFTAPYASMQQALESADCKPSPDHLDKPTASDRCTRAVEIDLETLRVEAQQELDEEVAAFAADCGEVAAESIPPVNPDPDASPKEELASAASVSAPTTVTSSDPDPRPSASDSDAEEAELAAAIKASLEAAEEQKRLEALEDEQMAFVMGASSRACATAADSEDEELAKAIRASLLISEVSAACTEPVAGVDGIAPGELDLAAEPELVDDDLAHAVRASLLDAAETSASAKPVGSLEVAAPAEPPATREVDAPAAVSTTLSPADQSLSSDVEVEHLLKVTLATDMRRLRASWSPSARPDDVLTRIYSTVRCGFGLRSSTKCLLKYEDEDGDMCTLVEPTVQDFLDSARGGTLRISVEVATDGASHSSTESQPHTTSAGDSAIEDVWAESTSWSGMGDSREHFIGTPRENSRTSAP